MEESTALELLQEVKEIKTALIGDPKYNHIGIVQQVKQNTDDIKSIKDNGVRVKWFWMGGAAAVGATGGILGKTWLGKAIAAMFGGSQMIK